MPRTTCTQTSRTSSTRWWRRSATQSIELLFLEDEEKARELLSPSCLLTYPLSFPHRLTCASQAESRAVPWARPQKNKERYDPTLKAGGKSRKRP